MPSYHNTYTTTISTTTTEAFASYCGSKKSWNISLVFIRLNTSLSVRICLTYSHHHHHHHLLPSPPVKELNSCSQQLILHGRKTSRARSSTSTRSAHVRSVCYGRTIRHVGEVLRCALVYDTAVPSNNCTWKMQWPRSKKNALIIQL